MSDLKIYPHFAVENNKKPNRWLAFPFLGIIMKVILLIPVFLEMMFLGFIAFFVLVINWFIISFTGKYWDSAYKLFLGMMRLMVKIKLYILGLTDKYPGFTFDTNKLFTLDITKPEKPNVWLAIPLLGIAIRVILLIPYLIFVEVMEKGSGVAMILSWFAVTFKSKFPESLYEFEKDTIRVALASGMYLLGLSDKYPSFNISMNHQTAKILLIIAGAILTSWRMDSAFMSDSDWNQSSYKYSTDYSSQTNTDYKTY